MYPIPPPWEKLPNFESDDVMRIIVLLIMCILPWHLLYRTYRRLKIHSTTLSTTEWVLSLAAGFLLSPLLWFVTAIPCFFMGLVAEYHTTSKFNQHILTAIYPVISFLFSLGMAIYFSASWRARKRIREHTP